MKFSIYSVRDKLSGYMNISLEKGDAIATRSFTTLVNTPDTVLFANPGDYDLYKVGEFDSESGTIESCVPSYRILQDAALHHYLRGDYRL
jgi:hypothetical protein